MCLPTVAGVEYYLFDLSCMVLGRLVAVESMAVRLSYVCDLIAAMVS